MSDKYKKSDKTFSGIFDFKVRPYGKFALVAGALAWLSCSLETTPPVTIINRRSVQPQWIRSKTPNLAWKQD